MNSQPLPCSTVRRPRTVYHVQLRRGHPPAQRRRPSPAATRPIYIASGCIGAFAALVLLGFLAFCGLFGAAGFLIASNF